MCKYRKGVDVLKLIDSERLFAEVKQREYRNAELYRELGGRNGGEMYWWKSIAYHEVCDLIIDEPVIDKESPLG